LIIRDTAIPGVKVIEPKRHGDERGFFARTWLREVFAAAGLEVDLEQSAISHNPRAGTLRGMHYQVEPHSETRLVRCTRGSLYDVALDLRQDSPTFLGWHAEELSVENRLGLYIPRGCAHGFLTLEDDTEVFYQITAAYAPEKAAGVRWNDPAFAIEWPAAVEVIAERDACYPDFTAFGEGAK
jgi:dTDP-4-dehydrorhamnose 3,5-epimerase